MNALFASIAGHSLDQLKARRSDAQEALWRADIAHRDATKALAESEAAVLNLKTFLSNVDGEIRSRLRLDSNA